MTCGDFQEAFMVGVEEGWCSISQKSLHYKKLSYVFDSQAFNCSWVYTWESKAIPNDGYGVKDRKVKE